MDLDALERKITKFFHELGDLDEMHEQLAALKKIDPAAVLQRLDTIEAVVGQLSTALSDFRAKVEPALAQLGIIVDAIEAAEPDEPAVPGTPAAEVHEPTQAEQAADDDAAAAAARAAIVDGGPGTVPSPADAQNWTPPTEGPRYASPPDYVTPQPAEPAPDAPAAEPTPAVPANQDPVSAPPQPAPDPIADAVPPASDGQPAA